MSELHLSQCNEGHFVSLEELQTCPNCGKLLVSHEFNSDYISSWSDLRKMHANVLKKFQEVHSINENERNKYFPGHMVEEGGKVEVHAVTMEDIKYLQRLSECEIKFLLFLQESILPKYQHFRPDGDVNA